VTAPRSGRRDGGAPRAPRTQGDPAHRAGSSCLRRLSPALASLACHFAACGAPEVIAGGRDPLPAAAPFPELVARGELPVATLIPATARLTRRIDGHCVIDVDAVEGGARVAFPCADTLAGPIEVAVPLALRIVGGRPGVPELVEVFRADDGFLRDSFGARLLVAGRGGQFPLRLGTDVRVELGAGADQRVASEVVSRSDGCTFAFGHGRLGLSDRERFVWAAAGQSENLRVEGVPFAWSVFAVALPARSDDGCEASPEIGFTLVRPFAEWPRGDEGDGLSPAPPPPP
jgi:hypothetical protein